MDVLNDKMEGFSGESEQSRQLRWLWEQAWRRTATQVDNGFLPSRLFLWCNIHVFKIFTLFALFKRFTLFTLCKSYKFYSARSYPAKDIVRREVVQ